jgi:hypothetical protein
MAATAAAVAAAEVVAAELAAEEAGWSAGSGELEIAAAMVTVTAIRVDTSRVLGGLAEGDVWWWAGVEVVMMTRA